MNSRIRPWFSVLWLGAACLAAMPARAESSASDAVPSIKAVRIGFADVCRVGHWSPLWITVSGGSDPIDARISVTAKDGDGVPVAFAAADRVQIPARGDIAVLRYIKPGRPASDLTVRLVATDGTEIARRVFRAAELPRPKPSTQEMILALGPAVGLEDAARKARRGRSYESTICQTSRAEDMPTAWFGYEGVDWAVVTTSETSVLEQMSDEQFAAFDRWLQLGGRMVLCVGQRGDQVFAAGQRLARFAPGTNARVIAQRVTSALESYAGTSERLDALGGERATRFKVSMTVLNGLRGTVECAEVGGPDGRLPTIVRYPYGFGQIVCLAFDPDQPPFTAWQGLPTLMARVLQMTSPDRQQELDVRARVGQMTNLGYDDIVGQLRAALDQFQGVTRLSFSWVAALLGVFILLIGPGDYYLLKKLNRPEWTWASFPLITLVFCGVVYVLAGRLSGRGLHVNQVDVVDLDVERHLLRSTAWTHLYSPTTQEFSLTLDSAVPWAEGPSDVAGQLLAWQGLPGRGLGGLDAASTPTRFEQPYSIAEPASSEASAIGRMPVEVAGSKALAAQCWTEPQPRNTAERLQVDSNGLLSGRVVNPLAVELTDCAMLYANWIYPLTGSLEPGEAVAFDGVSPRNLEWHLTRRRVVDTRDVGTPWDRTSSDVPRILEVLMFYKAAGGETYTSLTHRYQPVLDLSDHLRTGRAILVGRGAEPAGRWQRDDGSLAEQYDRHWTFYRLVFPVDKP